MNMDLDELLAEIDVMIQRVIKHSFVMWQLGEITLDEFTPDQQAQLKEIASDRDFLLRVISDPEQCKCGGDHCKTVRACEIALAKLDGTNVVQIASWTKH
jgi:hypothetical protein